MSLINQMLKDLEQRGAGSNDTERIISSQLNPASKTPLSQHASQENGTRVLKISGLMVLIAGGAYLWLQSTPVQSQVANLLNKINLVNKTKVASRTTSASAQVSQTQVNPTPIATKENTVYDLDDENTKKSASAHIGSASIFESKLSYIPIEAYAPAIKKSNNVTLAKYVTNAGGENKTANSLHVEASAAPLVPIDSKEKATLDTSEKVALTGKTSQAAESKLIGKQIRPEQKAENYYRQAIANLQQGRVAEAQVALAQSLEINPANQDARQTLAGLLIDNKRHDEAKNVLAAGLTIAPDQSNFRMVLARLQLEVGDRVSALNTLEQGQSYAKSNGDYQGFYATLLQRADRHEEAVNHYQAALAINSNSATSLVGLGISLQALGKLNQAQEAFNRAAATDSLNPELAQFVALQIKQINQSLANK